MKRNMKLGYLGPEGTFSHEAARRYGHKRGYELVGYGSIRDCILAVHEGAVEEALVPIENSIEGSVNVTIDMLVHDVNVYIRKELVLPIRHFLLAKPGTALEQIERVLSHPQALAQCRGYLTRYLPRAEEQLMPSTAEAAVRVSESREPWAAIASQKAAALLGLAVLDEDIQDHQNNSTRFIVLSKVCDESDEHKSKTSIAFTVTHKPGSLLKALQIFADQGVNLTRIESRPMRTLLGQYLFLIDLEGHVKDETISNILDKIEIESQFYKFLGSYSLEQEKSL